MGKGVVRTAVYFWFNFRNTVLLVFLFFHYFEVQQSCNQTRITVTQKKKYQIGKVTLSKAGYYSFFSVGQVAGSCSIDFFFSTLPPEKKKVVPLEQTLVNHATGTPSSMQHKVTACVRAPTTTCISAGRQAVNPPCQVRP